MRAVALGEASPVTLKVDENQVAALATDVVEGVFERFEMLHYSTLTFTCVDTPLRHRRTDFSLGPARI